MPAAFGIAFWHGSTQGNTFFGYPTAHFLTEPHMQQVVAATFAVASDEKSVTLYPRRLNHAKKRPVSQPELMQGRAGREVVVQGHWPTSIAIRGVRIVTAYCG